MKRSFALTLIALCIFAMFAPVHSASAATIYTAEITDTQINADIALVGPVDGLRNLSLEVQDGRLAMIGDTTNPSIHFIFGILGSVNNGQLNWNLMGASVNNVYATPEQLATINAQYNLTPVLTQLVEYFLKKYGTSFYFTGLTLTPHTITVQFSTSGPAIASTSASVKPAVTQGGTPLSNCTVTTTAGLNLRASASQRGAVVAVVPAGTALAAASRQGAWFFVAYQGSQGWLNSAFLKWIGTCS